ncbi:MAG: replicative DNA helicase, partial [Clostridia bacterium]|nr:replicative DNA helicase [Clostridia bacterium]
MEKKNGKINGFKEMPHSLEAERALLGCILMDAKIQVEVAGAVKEHDFYTDNHRVIFKAMDEIIAKNQPLDMVVLIDALEKKGALEIAGGIDYIVKLTDILPSYA